MHISGCNLPLGLGGSLQHLPLCFWGLAGCLLTPNRWSTNIWTVHPLIVNVDLVIKGVSTTLGFVNRSIMGSRRSVSLRREVIAFYQLSCPIPFLSQPLLYVLKGNSSRAHLSFEKKPASWKGLYWVPCPIRALHGRNQIWLLTRLNFHSVLFSLLLFFLLSFLLSSLSPPSFLPNFCSQCVHFSEAGWHSWSWAMGTRSIAPSSTC